MTVIPAEPPEEQPVPARAVQRVAALDDYLGGFAPTVVSSPEPDDDPPEVTGLVDTILLLRQTAAADGVTPNAPPVPTSIGRHAILRLAGEGGFATVWQGFDTVLRRPVAVKVRRPEALLSDAARRRFVREAQIAARLVHPHIVTIYEVGEDNGREFIAAEFCSGGNLADWLQTHPGPLAPRGAAQVVRALAGAVAYAHTAGVVHRDIKPGNVLLVPAYSGTEAILDAAAPDGAGLTVKLGDFGLGKVWDETESSDQMTNLTRTGTRVGTPAWMAPEQIDPSFGQVGPATDVHALGLLLHRLLTGYPLWGGGTDAETYRQVLLAEPVAADHVAKTVPRDLAAVAAKCLSKQARHRYQSASALVDDLTRWLDGRATLARPLSAAVRSLRWIRRRPVVSALAVAAITTSIVAGWSGIERARVADHTTRREAEIRRQRAAAELRRGFDSLRTGNVAEAIQQLEMTRTIDAALANSLAGRWLLRRAHGERETLVAPPPNAMRPGAGLRGLYAIAISPDGTTAAVAGADGGVRLLRGLDRASSMREITVVPAHDEVNDVGFSNDGARLVTAGQDGRVRWWRITEAGLTAGGEVHPAAGPLYAAAFTPDGRGIVIGGEDRVVRLLNTDTAGRAAELFQFEKPPGKAPDIESLAFVSGSTLAAACGDVVVLLDTETGRLIREFERPEKRNRNAVFGSLAISPTGDRVMACGTDAEAHIWEVATGRLMTSLPTHPGWVQGCCFVDDGSLVATACRDGGVRVFDASSGAALAKLVGHHGRVWSVACEPAGTLLTCGADGTVRRWDPKADFETAPLRDIPADGREIFRIEEIPSSGGRGHAAIAVDEQGRLWHTDVPRGSSLLVPQADGLMATHVAVDAARRRLAVSSNRPEPIQIVSLAESASVPASVPISLPESAEPRQAISCWTPAGGLLVCTRSASLCMMPPALAGGIMLQAPLEEPVHAMAMAPAGVPRVAIAGKRSVVLPLPDDLSSQTLVPLPVALGEDATAVAWSPDGTLLACGTRSGRTILFDASTGEQRGALASHERGVIAIAFSHDGRILLTADRGAVRITDVSTLTTLDEIRPGWHVRAMLLAADEGCLLLGGSTNSSTGTGSARLAALEFDLP